MLSFILSKNAPKLFLVLILTGFNLYQSYFIWRFKRLMMTSLHTTSTRKSELTPYSGPTLRMEDMEALIYVEDICLNVMVGPSIAAQGRGLFLSLRDDGEEVTLPAGQVICGYNKGSFEREAYGDKTVGYSFKDVRNGVIFEKKLMPLFDAIMLAKDLTKSNSVSTIVHGHILSSDDAGDVHIEQAPDFYESYFVPKVNNKFLSVNMGIFANDFAFSFNVAANTYSDISMRENILQLVWRLTLTDGKLVPSWPVVILISETKFTNREPMEVGLYYSWKYWQVVLEAKTDGDDCDG